MPRRIFFCTIGLTSQVVTETVWVLGRRAPPWIPDEIHVVTTAFALSNVRATLQAPNGRLATLLGGKLPPVTIHVPSRGERPIVFEPVRGPGDLQDQSSGALQKIIVDSKALMDVNTQEDAAIMGNLILRLMAGFAHDPDTEIHISLAGGRKTMSAHALLALSLVGRARDEASHVLVSPVEFEDHPEFWYPEQGGLIHTKEDLRKNPVPGPTLDPKKANIVLVPTPAPLMRHEVKDVTSLERLDLAEIVKLVNLAAVLRSDPHVHLDTKRNTIEVGGVERRFAPKFFAIYRLIAQARKEGWRGVGPDGDEIENAGRHAGWLSAPHICIGLARSGIKIEEILLRFLKDAVTVDGGDPDDHRSINEWRNVIAETDPARKLDRAEKAFGANRRLIDAFKEAFGSPAAAIVAPDVVHLRQTRPIRGGKIWAGGATRFGLRPEFSKSCIAIV